MNTEDYIKSLEETNAKLEEIIKRLEKRTVVWKSPDDSDSFIKSQITESFLNNNFIPYSEDTFKEIIVVEILFLHKRIISSIVKYKGFYRSSELVGSKFKLDRISDIKTAVEETVLFGKTDIVADEQLQLEAQIPKDISNFSQFVMPMIKKVFAGQHQHPINSVIGVQPMSKPSGKIHYRNHSNKKDTKGY